VYVRVVPRPFLFGILCLLLRVGSTVFWAGGIMMLVRVGEVDVLVARGERVENEVFLFLGGLVVLECVA
jgi:hypothetical protein